MEIRGDRVTLRPVVRKDAPALAEMLATPEVARWWPAYDLARVEAEFLVNEPDYVVYSIDVDGRLVGMIQTHEEPEPEFRHASVDLFLDPAVHGQGLGPEAIRAVIGHLVAVDGHHRLTIDPAADNERAIRAYEKVGFRPVGRLRQYQRFPDGTWHDGLLMELLAEDMAEDRAEDMAERPAPARSG
jgi:aminoglycoside 6'-N-acetyltransferase